MPGSPARRPLSRLVRTAPALVLGCVPALTDAAAKTTPTDDGAMIDIVFQLEDGMKTTHDQPRVVLWIEDRNRRFVKTLYRFGQKDPKHYEDLPVSFALYSKAEAQGDLDAVTGATLIWGSQGQVRLPARWRGLDLLSGRFVLRIESAKDHGKHFPGLSIPLSTRTLDKVVKDKGYVQTVSISQAPEGAAIVTAPTMIPDPKGPPAPLPPGQVETATAIGTVVKVAPATKNFPFMPCLTLKMDGSGDIIEHWPRKQQAETDAIIQAILASKPGQKKQIVYTESKGARILEMTDVRR